MKISTDYHRALAACRPLALLTIATLAPALAGAQQVTPLFGNSAGAISQVAAAQVAQDQFVTAVINSSGNLEVIAWYVNLSTNQLLRQGTWYAGPASAVSISSSWSVGDGNSYAPGAFTTAAINANGNLDITYWQVQSNGAISLINEVQGDWAWLVSVAFVYTNGTPQFMTAIRNSYGNLEVSLWTLNSSKQIQLSGTAFAGAIYSVSLACLHDVNSDVVTAVENSSGELQVIQWYYNRFGAAVSRGNTTYPNIPIQNAVVAPGLFAQPGYQGGFYTAAVNAYNSQTTVSLGDPIAGPSATVTAGTSSQLAVVGTSNTALTVSTPSSSGGNYSIWVFSNSQPFSQVTGNIGAYATAVSTTWVDTSSLGHGIFAVAYRNSAGNLQIQLWNYVSACSSCSV